jgi:hypothetical protein
MRLSEIDEDLGRLEADIRQMKIQYEQYFGGGKKRPPKDVEWRIDQTAKRYGDRGADMNYGQRFRYSTLMQTYTKYREIFQKRLKRQEEGHVQRHFGAAARAVEAERTRKPKLPDPVVVACSNPAGEPNKVAELYQAFREALERSGEDAQKLSRENFEKFLQQKAAQLRNQKNSKSIEFVVAVENGKTRLKARFKS